VSLLTDLDASTWTTATAAISVPASWIARGGAVVWLECPYCEDRADGSFYGGTRDGV